MKRYLQLTIGVLVSAIFIYWALPGLHLPTVVEALQTANYWWLAPGVAVYMIGLWVRTWRWQYTLRPVKLVPVATLFPMVCIGYFGNNIFPFRAGELLRSYVLKRRTDIAISTSLATVIVERITDGLVMLLFVFLALPFAPMPSAYRNAVISMTILFLAATVVFMWMASQPQRVERFYAIVASAVLRGPVRQRTDDFYHRFMLGLSSLSHPSDVIMIFLTSVLIWLLETVKYWFVMHAFDFSVSFIVLMLMNGLVNLATTLPAAPGYIGTFDTPGIKTLEAFGVDPSVAAGYTFTLHAALWAPVTLLGGYFFWREHLHMSDIDAARQQAEAPAEVTAVRNESLP
ncbi:lysylphosphatidylglycerol synthase transmembrane domain-containing protein [Caldilinea sp.]|uniref:lysylphosphatidylglycerol synthase transmembrane domain-containing protein n=1 Tax=Caldilinea sp. TaxID=2293560 RepID=UPI002CEC4EB3|nr:lysylphosphatidylglycerol synthase transmembrane domain-containing protein [Caldilinea sp.]HRA65616.1 lysylphosphatidylglycerol synthase transmembrane domain-containing protein [Caldilinea sp.]